MYMILVWGANDFLDTVKNKDGSIKLFENIEEADNYANQMSSSDDARVISIEGVEK